MSLPNHLNCHDWAISLLNHFLTTLALQCKFEISNIFQLDILFINKKHCIIYKPTCQDYFSKELLFFVFSYWGECELFHFLVKMMALKPENFIKT